MSDNNNNITKDTKNEEATITSVCDAQKKKVDDYLNSLIENGELVGIQYMVMNPDEVLYQYNGGVKDVLLEEQQQGNISINDQSTFLSSSITKILTAAGILKLYDTDQLDIDDPLDKYIPTHPYDTNHTTTKLTIRHLLNQTSGIPNPIPIDWLHTYEEEHNNEYNEKKVLEKIVKENSNLIDKEPGTKYSYSNLSYWLLGSVIEKVSNMSYKEYMTKHIFEPLQILPNELSFEICDTNHHTRGHEKKYSFMHVFLYMMTLKKNYFLKSATSPKTKTTWSRYNTLYMNGPSYGGCIGTATGYRKFLQDMLSSNAYGTTASPNSSKLFTNPQKNTKELFFSKQYDNQGNALPTTLGWHTGTLLFNNENKETSNIEYYYKAGGGPGYNSNIRIYPKHNIATIYLCNQTNVDSTSINAFSDSLDKHFF